MSDDTAVIVEGVWKRYGLGLRQRLGALSNGNRASEDDGPWALKDINFEVSRGETLGVIGRNGAGKSTLLKVLAGVTPVTRGTAQVFGRLFPMIELSAGLHMELTGRENVHLLGAIMGLSRREIVARMKDIEEFTELGEWFDKPVRMYSSGMLARLGFGVAMNVDSDVILVDEVLAVGDLGFQRKCWDRIHEIRGRNKTILLVSHNPYQIERLCDRVLLLDRGEAQELASARDTIVTYYRLINTKAMAKATGSPGNGANHERSGTGEMRVTKVRTLDRNGLALTRFRTLDEIVIEIHLDAFKPIVSPSLRIDFVSAANIVVTSVSLQNQMTAGLRFDGASVIYCRIPKLLLMSGRYHLQIKLSRDVMLDFVSTAAEFEVVLNDPGAILSSNNAGIFYCAAEWDLGTATYSDEANLIPAV